MVKMEENLLIYQSNVVNTYLYFIKENISLIRSSINKNQNLIKTRNNSKKYDYYYLRAKHIQVMTLLGITTEHLIKIILLKRGFVLNTSNIDAKFDSTFIIELESNKNRKLNQEELDDFYDKSKQNVKINFKKELKNFNECLSLFEKSCPKNYYRGLKSYNLNPHPQMYNDCTYFGYKTIKPNETLQIIKKMRNSYIHLAEPNNEQNGVIYYLFNFLVWLAKKEYPEFFKKIRLIGTNDVKRLF